ncbi:MAG TPA: hypothetical protein VMI56_07485 [Reyranella sp.]|nr:hypothetical protein [Reyranella sp.]
MYLTIAILVALLVFIPTLFVWLLRSRGVKPGPFHDDPGTRFGGGDGGGH